MGDYRISCLIYLLVCLLAYLFILLFRLFKIGILYVRVLAVLEELFIFKAQALKKNLHRHRSSPTNTMKELGDVPNSLLLLSAGLPI